MNGNRPAVNARTARAVAVVVLSLAAVVAGGPAAAARPIGRVATTGVAASPSARAICRRLRSHVGARALGRGRKHLTMLATGDSMIYPASEELASERPRGMRVVVDRHDGTGLTVHTVDWNRLARRQAARIRPDATVISIGGRDGGIPLKAANGQLVGCCGAQWLSLYAQLLRPLANAYLRSGHGRIYWLMIPAPRETARAPLFDAVNQAVRLLATEIGPSIHVVPVDTAISPGGFQKSITYDGVSVAPRAPDGIHLTHAGACVERSLVFEAMLADGLLSATLGP